MTNNIQSIFDNLDVEATDELLKDITEVKTSSGMTNRISKIVYKKIGIRGKTARPLWLIPAVALIAAVITIAAIPDARAAVADFFDSMFNIHRYIAEDKEERPAISAVEQIIQTPAPASSGSAGTAQSFKFSDISDDAQFLSNVNVKVDEVLYDGEQFIVTAALAGDIREFGDARYIAGDYMFPPCNVVFTGEDGKVRQCSGAVNFFTPPESSIILSLGPDNTEKFLDEIKLIISCSDEKLSLSGMQQVAVKLEFHKRGARIDEHSSTVKPIGSCTLNFKFDATEGHNSLKTIRPDKTIKLTGEAPITEFIENDSYIKIKKSMLSLDGCEVRIEHVSCKPTGISVKLLYKCADGWTDLQKAAYLGGIGYGLDFDIVINGKDYGPFGNEYGDYDKTWSYVNIDIPITGDEQDYIESFEILPVMNYIYEINGIAVTSQQQKIPVDWNGEEGGWSQESDKAFLESCKFTVDLP